MITRAPLYCEALAMKRYTLGTLIAAILLTAVSVFNISYVLIWNAFDSRLSALNDREAEYAKLNEIRAYLDEYYILDTDSASLTEGAAAGMVNTLPDGWSYYQSADEYAAYTNTTADDYTGIGVTAYYDKAAGGMRITEVYAESPAQQAGIRFFDIITAVNGRSTLELGNEASVSAIRGESGTDVELTVFRPSSGETLTFTVTRGEITERELQYELLDGGVGYIRIAKFSEGVDMQFEGAVKSLMSQGAKSLLFDVRFNPGGRMDVLANMLDLLLPKGTLIRWEDKKGKAGSMSSDAAHIELPMAVLAHEYSYSAAEFFAAALQEYEAAVVVGTQTMGKCYAQTTYVMSDGSAIAISTLEYTTPGGKNLAQTGVTPDYKLALSYEETVNFWTLGFEEDPQIQKAIELLR